LGNASFSGLRRSWMNWWAGDCDFIVELTVIKSGVIICGG
jgi:hypothetical protein